MAGSITDDFSSNGATWTNLSDGTSWTHATVNATNFDTSPTYDNTSGLGRALYKLNQSPAATLAVDFSSTSNASTYTSSGTVAWALNTTYLLGIVFMSNSSGTAAPTLSSCNVLDSLTLVTGTDTTISSASTNASYSIAWYTGVAKPANTAGASTVGVTATGTSQGCQFVLLSMGTEASVRNGTFARCSGGNTAEASPKTVTVTASDLNTSTVIGYGVCDKNAATTAVSGTNYTSLSTGNAGTPAVSVAAGTIATASLASSNAIGLSWAGGTNQVWAVSACEVYDPDEASSNTSTGTSGLLTHKAGSLSMRDVEIYAKVDNGYQGPMARMVASNSFIFARQIYASWNGGATLSWGIAVYTCIAGTITALTAVNGTNNADGKTASPYQNIAIRCYDASTSSTMTTIIEAKAYDDGNEPAWNASAGANGSMTIHSSTQALTRATTTSGTFAGQSGNFGLVTIVSPLTGDPSNTFGVDTFTLNVLPVKQQGNFLYRQAIPRASRW